MLQWLGKVAPVMRLARASDKMQIKTGDPIEVSELHNLHSEVLEHMKSDDNANRFVPLIPSGVTELAGTEEETTKLHVDPAALSSKIYSNEAFNFLKVTGAAHVWCFLSMLPLYFVSAWTYYRRVFIFRGTVTQFDDMVFTLPVAFSAIAFEELVHEWDKVPALIARLKETGRRFANKDMKEMTLTRYDAEWITCKTCKITKPTLFKVKAILRKKIEAAPADLPALTDDNDPMDVEGIEELQECLAELMEAHTSDHDEFEEDNDDLEGSVASFGDAPDEDDDFARERPREPSPDRPPPLPPPREPLGVPEHVMSGVQNVRDRARISFRASHVVRDTRAELCPPIQAGTISLVEHEGRALLVRWEHPIADRLARECRLDTDSTIKFIIARWCPMLHLEHATIIVHDTGLEMVKNPDEREPIPQWVTTLLEAANAKICSGPLLDRSITCLACDANASQPGVGNWNIRTGRGGLFRCCMCLCIWHADCAVRFDQDSLASVFSAFWCQLCLVDPDCQT